VASPEQLADEARRAQKVRQVVDIATNLIMQGSMTRHEVEGLVATVRQRILVLFPDGEQTYEIIYAPRFRRLIDEFALPSSGRSGVILSFPPPRG
jgi:hypothetical protein